MSITKWLFPDTAEDKTNAPPDKTRGQNKATPLSAKSMVTGL
jgi:hypothetical protein